MGDEQQNALFGGGSWLDIIIMILQALRNLPQDQQNAVGQQIAMQMNASPQLQQRWNAIAEQHAQQLQQPDPNNPNAGVGQVS